MVEPTGRILLVDDERPILEIMSRILQKQGFTVATAETGRTAIQKIKNDTFDTVLVDLKLQDVNGIDLLRMITAVNPDIKKIVLTGEVLTDEKSKSILDEADGLLMKPCTAQELVEALKQVAEKPSS